MNSQQRYYEENKAKVNEKSLARYYANPSRASELAKARRERLKAEGLCRDCGSRPPLREGLSQCQICTDRASRYAETYDIKRKENRQKLKRAAFDAYGGPICICCGDEHMEFLNIDHINGGGNKHLKEIHAHLYQWLKKNNYPSGFQVLCYNCNCSRAHQSDKVCVHQKELPYTISYAL